MMKNTFKLLPVLVATALLTACPSDDDDNTTTPPESSVDWTKTNAWFEAGQNTVITANETDVNLTRGSAKNVILFVGDGMGVSTVTAARILAGQIEGQTGEEYQLSFDKFPVAGLLKTYNTNQQTPDSAGTMTAMISGAKTKAGVIGLSEKALRADCASGQGEELVTAIELAEMAGKSTGIISTARITHATPAATYAKSSERNWESDDGLSEEAKTNGCKDIAQQLIDFNYGDGIDVVLGGGRRHFIPSSLTDEEGKNGKRQDGQNLISLWQSKHSNGQYVFDQSGFDAVDTTVADKLLGLFNSSHMEYEADRANDVAGEPSLSQMTEKSLQILSKNDKGFFLTVESGRVDHAHHAGNAYRALYDAVEFAKAIEVAMNSVDLNETLIVVTADHSHVLTLAGYPTRGNPILGLVKTNDSAGNPESEPVLAGDERPYTTLGYTNGLGYANYGDDSFGDQRYSEQHNTGRHVHTDEDTESSGFHQESLVPLGSETHAGEDVGVYAIGPGAQLLRGVNEQSMVFHAIDYAADLINQAEVNAVQ
ncbi:alkaline phosphatase [Kangiella aquimarina]|uniref:Alkaline phosphatase n=2 Tax=Kangiella aquimarina TaxID=261965 RepID=A0ABZ0X267_9GAMM|nr:alkaline phosphatase [Kangiella aquimarina]WQG84682.1 alkaline phosphatase [Kangiella aquimarina]